MGQNEENNNKNTLAEVLTPLMSSILANMQMANERIREISEDEENEALDYYVSVMGLGLAQMERMTKNILTFSNAQKNNLVFSPNELDLVSFCQQICEAVTFLTELRGIEVKFETRLSKCVVIADADLLEQLVMNLIVNSLTSISGAGEICIRLLEDMDNVIISLSDTGAGMSDISCRKLNDEEFNVDYSDGIIKLGAGLKVVRAIAKIHEAQLLMDSKIGVGTTVSLKFKKEREPSLRFEAMIEPYEIDMKTALRHLSPWLKSSEYRTEYLD